MSGPELEGEVAIEPSTPPSETARSERFRFHFATGDGIGDDDIKDLEIHFAGFTTDFEISPPGQVPFLVETHRLG